VKDYIHYITILKGYISVLLNLLKYRKTSREKKLLFRNKCKWL